MARPSVIAVLACVAAMVCAAPATADRPPRMHGHAQTASPAGPLLKRGSAHAAASRKWATVNICDTEKTPDGMGLRASMPGNGTSQRMFMRFTAQWYSGSQNAWLDVPGGVSRWIYAGSARYVSRQAGYTFDFVTPPAGRGCSARGRPAATAGTRRRRSGRRSRAGGSLTRARSSRARASRASTAGTRPARPRRSA